MKKKILLISAMVTVLFCVFAISALAANNIIKLDTCPTLEEIHANREAYVSHLDAFDDAKYDGKDKDSVVVLSDLADPPTYYVYPAYYYMPGSSLAVYSTIGTLNSAISEADSTAFAGYASNDGNWGQGGCKYLIRIEIPTHVTTIAGRAKFENSPNLLEVYFPVHEVTDPETGVTSIKTYVTSVSGENLFSSCKKLEYIHNMGYLPAGIITGNNAAFSGCYALKEIVVPYGATSLPNYCFSDCRAVKEIILPNTVTYAGKQAFANCHSLEVVSFGANFTSFGSPNNDYETFSSSNNLKFVYMPATIVNSLVNYTGTSLKNQFKNIFSNSSKVVYFLVGDEDDVTLIKEKFAETAANNNIANADVMAFDQGVDYVELQAGLTKSVIVYGYSACEAFYDGVHDVAENFTLEYSGQELLSSAIKSKACANCSFKVDRTDLNPLVECLGYSSNGMGDIVQGFSLNVTDLAEYEAVLGDISYGVIAAVDLRAEGEREEGVDIFGLEKHLAHDLSQSPYNYFNVRVSGITEELYDQHLFFCAYITYGDEYMYINNGMSGKTATSTTYNLAK